MLIFWLISSDSECITLVQLAETDSVKSCRAFRNGRTKRGIMKPRRSAPRETNRQTKSHSKDSPPPKGKKEREGSLLLSSLSPLRRSNSFFTSSFVSADFLLFSEAGRWRGATAVENRPVGAARPPGALRPHPRPGNGPAVTLNCHEHRPLPSF